VLIIIIIKDGKVQLQ